MSKYALEWVVVAAILVVLFWQLVLPSIKSGKPPQAAAPGQPNSSWRWIKDKAGYVWPVLLVILVIAIAVWGGLFEATPSTMSFASVNKWVWSHGPALLLIAGIAAITIAFYGGASKSIWFQALGWTIALLFVGSWVGSWFEPSSSKETVKPVVVQQAPAQKVCPDMTTSEKRSCFITSDKWSNWVRMESGAKDYSLKPCHSAGVKSEITNVGATMLRFRARDGEVEVKYQLFPLDTNCFAIGF